MRVEIRCCCDPGKLLGTVSVDAEHISEGQVFTFRIPAAISLRPFWEQRDGDLFKPEPAETLALPVAFWQGDIYEIGSLNDETTWKRNMGLALKSNDTPIELLRRIPGFQEAR